MQKLLFLLFIGFANLAIGQNTLRHYVDAATQNSPLLFENHGLNEVNKLEAERLKAFYTKPQIGLTAYYLFSPIVSTDGGKTRFVANTDAATNYYGYDLAASNGGTYSALLNITQPLFNGKSYRTTAQQLEIASQINDNNSKLSVHDLEKVVTDQYILCLQDEQQVLNIEELLTLLKEQQRLLEKLVGSGIYKRSDLLLLNIEQQNILGQQAVYEANYKRDLMDLNILCGMNDTAIVQLAPLELSVEPKTYNSLFLKKYELDSLSIDAQQRIFALKYRPQLNVFANTGLNAVVASTLPSRFGLSAGLSFTYNFFDGNQRGINKQQNKLRIANINNYKRNFETQNSVRKQKLLTELESYTVRGKNLDEQLRQYDALIDSYRQEMAAGQLSVINYITVLKNQSIAGQNKVLLDAQKLILINAYQYWNW